MKSCAPTARAARDDLVERRVGLSERDVVGDRTAEQVGLLRHHDDGAAEVLRVQRPQIDAVERHSPVGRVVEPRHELGEGRLAGTRRSDQGDRLAGRDVEREVRQHRAVAAVPERHSVEPHVPAGGPQVDGGDGIRNGRLLFEDSRHLLERRGGRLVRVQEERDLLHRREEVADVHDGSEKRADGERAVGDADRAPEKHGRHRDRRDRHESRLEGAEEPDRAQVHVAVLSRRACRTPRRCAAPCGRP